MTEKRFERVYGDIEVVCIDHQKTGDDKFIDDVDYDKFVDLLNELNDENEQLKKQRYDLYMDIARLVEENEQLKQQLMDCKKDEKELSISFMEYKMQLIDVLQQNYNYAYNQRQRNLDKSIVARTYEVLYQTIDAIAETMNVDIERFPKR